MKLYAEKNIEEYLIVDYRNKTIEQYYLNKDKYELNKLYEKDDVCTAFLSLCKIYYQWSI